MASVAGASPTRVAVAEEDDHVRRARPSVGGQDGLRRGDRICVIGAEPTYVPESVCAAGSSAASRLHEVGGGVEGRGVRRAVIARERNDVVERLNKDRVATGD